MATTGLQADSAPVTPDAQIISALANYRAARATYDALPVSTVDGEDYTPDELAQWALMDAAEGEIRSHLAATPQGIEAKLWLALLATQSGSGDDRAAAAGDLDHFLAKEESLDWGIRMIVSAIASLRAMETGAGRA